jgi:hypothetical protein
MIAVAMLLLVAVASVSSESVSTTSQSAQASSQLVDPSVVCDAVRLAVAAAALAKNDTCFDATSATSCESCAINKGCAFCSAARVTVSGVVLGTTFVTTCDFKATCWEGNFFAFVAGQDSVRYDGNDLQLQVACDDELPQFMQCWVSGVNLMLIAGGVALALLLLCVCFVVVAVRCCCGSSGSRQARYERLSEAESSTNAKRQQVHAPYAGDRKGYGGSSSQI